MDLMFCSFDYNYFFSCSWLLIPSCCSFVGPSCCWSFLNCVDSCSIACAIVHCWWCPITLLLVVVLPLCHITITTIMSCCWCCHVALLVLFVSFHVNIVDPSCCCYYCRCYPIVLLLFLFRCVVSVVVISSHC